MSERMRIRADDALCVLRTLCERGYSVEIRHRRALVSLCVGGKYWFDAGTLDDALLQIDLAQFPARAA